MKWGKKKPYPSSSSLSSSPSSSSHSRPSFISHVLPSSWLSKIKLMPEDTESKPRKLTKTSDSANSPKDSCVDGGRFYSGDGDAFWRLSFGEDDHDGKQLRSISNDSNEYPELPNSSCRSKITKVGEDVTQNFSSRRNSRENKTFSYAGRFGRDRQMKKKIAWKEHDLNWSFRKMTTNPEKESTKARDYKEEIAFVEDKESDSEWGRRKEKKKEEAKSRRENQRKSIHISREVEGRRTKGSSRIKIYSPRTSSKLEICRIKALEDTRKSKSKTQKKAREKTSERGRNLERFAVAKCSFDPHKDFRDSMIEMIMEKKMKRSEELEELLACYLTLNSDEYHELIIKVFREVWFDFNVNSVSAEAPG